jgi:hypothetical protein
MIGPWPDNGFIATKREARLICRACRKALGEGSECIETADAVYHRECGGAAVRPDRYSAYGKLVHMAYGGWDQEICTADTEASATAIANAASPAVREAAVNRAARALYESEPIQLFPWDSFEWSEQERYRDRVRIVAAALAAEGETPQQEKA